MINCSSSRHSPTNCSANNRMGIPLAAVVKKGVGMCRGWEVVLCVGHVEEVEVCKEHNWEIINWNTAMVDYYIR